MSKILVNNNAFDVAITDTGVTVAASSSYTIPPQDYPTFAASSDVIILVANSTLIVNDGGDDILVISNAVDIIKGWFPGTPVVASNTFFFDYFDTPGGVGPHTIMSYIVPAGKFLTLSRTEVTCRIESIVEIRKNSTAFSSLSTSAANPTTNYHWIPNRTFTAGDLIEIILTKRNGSPDNTFGVNLMGYLT